MGGYSFPTVLIQEVCINFRTSHSSEPTGEEPIKLRALKDEMSEGESFLP